MKNILNSICKNNVKRCIKHLISALVILSIFGITLFYIKYKTTSDNKKRVSEIELLKENFNKQLNEKNTLILKMVDTISTFKKFVTYNIAYDNSTKNIVYNDKNIENASKTKFIKVLVDKTGAITYDKQGVHYINVNLLMNPSKMLGEKVKYCYIWYNSDRTQSALRPDCQIYLSGTYEIPEGADTSRVK